MTPALFEALLERKRQGIKLVYMQTGILAAAVINFSQRAPEKAVSAMDFMPEFLIEEADKESGVDLRKMTPEQQAAFVRNQFMKRTYNRR